MLIIASIGPHLDENSIRKIILAGADVLRINFSYETVERNLKFIDTVEEILNNLNSASKIMIDLPLNKICLGDIELKLFSVKENEELIFQSGTSSPNCYEFIPVDTPHLAEKVKINQTISLGNGRVSMQVLEIINHDTIKIRALNNGIIKSYQTFNNETARTTEEMIVVYKKIIDYLANSNAKFLAIPYNKDKSFIDDIKKSGLLTNIPFKPKLIININHPITDEEIEGLCQDKTFNFVNIDRGELGVNMPFEKFGLYQQHIVAIAKKYNKPLIFATHILSSTIDNYIPTRSDIIDLTNIVQEDIAAGIIFSKETNASKRPAYAISTAKKIINEVLKSKKIK